MRTKYRSVPSDKSFDIQLRHSLLLWVELHRACWKHGEAGNAVLAGFPECGASNCASYDFQPLRRLYLEGLAHLAIRRGAWGTPPPSGMEESFGSFPSKNVGHWVVETNIFSRREVRFSHSLADQISHRPLPIRLNSSSAFFEVSLRLCYVFGFPSVCWLFFRTGRVSLLHRRTGRANESHSLPASTSSAAFLIGFPAPGSRLHLAPHPPVISTQPACDQRLDLPSCKRHRLRSRRLLTRPPQA